MTPAELRAIRDSLNPCGQSKLTSLLGWHHSTVWRNVSDQSPITESDALAIQEGMEIIESRCQLAEFRFGELQLF
jgi:hypothetical protein